MPGSSGRQVVLEKHSDSTFKTPLRIMQGDENELMYNWELAPPLAPQVPDRDVNYGQYTPGQVLE